MINTLSDKCKFTPSLGKRKSSHQKKLGLTAPYDIRALHSGFWRWGNCKGLFDVTCGYKSTLGTCDGLSTVLFWSIFVDLMGYLF